MATVLHQQSVFDLSVQCTGGINQVFEIALTNGLSITEVLEAGKHLEIPQTETRNQETARYYEANKIKPATALREVDQDVISNGGACNFCKLFE